MRILVLGGTHHVGRAVVEAALARGDAVTMLNRGVSGVVTAGAEVLRADRMDRAAMRAALGDREWDAVVDTWSGAPRAVCDSATMLASRAGHYTYVSTRSVYRWPMPDHMDESAPVVDADPEDEASDDYAVAKRGGELAAVTAFGDRALVARAGLILGPYEIVGRLPWWLRRLERGGRVLAPGPGGRPLQYIDARDLAGWVLRMAGSAAGGVFNTVSRPGHTTIGELLETAVGITGADAELVWTPPGVIEAAGISGWTDLPIWVPPTGELAALHNADVSAAYAAGLSCRPVAETVVGTWRWLREEGYPAPPPGRPALGLDPERERAVLDGL
jgi:nucleoside-diphosphate-sugar epimerase